MFSHIFNKAREWGYTALQNPCQGVDGFKETGRSRYITDAEFNKVRAHAHFTFIDAMDLALLTGQRPADVLKLKRTDIRDVALWIVQNTTGARVGIEITGELAPGPGLTCLFCTHHVSHLSIRVCPCAGLGQMGSGNRWTNGPHSETSVVSQRACGW